MKATSSISAAAVATDKAFATSGTASQQAAPDGGFLAMLDGIIQTSGNNGQASNDQTPGTHQGHTGTDHSLASAVDETGNEADADTLVATAADSLEAITLPAASALSPAAAITPSSAFGIAPVALVHAGHAAAAVSSDIKTTPSPSDDNALTIAAVQAGLVTASLHSETGAAPLPASPASNTAPVSDNGASPVILAAASGSALPVAANETSKDAPATTIGAIAAAPNATAPAAIGRNEPFITAETPATAAPATVPATLSQPAAAVTNEDAGAPLAVIAETPAKPAKESAHNDQADNDSQQSAILSALFAQAPLPTLPVAAPVAQPTAGKPVSPGAARAVPSSVPGSVGTSPTLSPPPVAGNGNHVASAVAVAHGSEGNDDAKPAITNHSAFASFGIAAPGSDQAEAFANNNAQDDTAATKTFAPAPATQAKGESVAALFALPEQASSKPSTRALTDDAADDKTVVPLQNSLDVGASGITLIHQSDVATASAPAGQISASSYAPPATPADQVALFVQRAASNGDHTMTIALDPIELGKVVVKLDFSKDGSVSASVTADRPETLTLLKNDHSTLTQALHNAGLSTNSGSLSFNLRDGGGSQQQQGFASASSYRAGRDSVAADDAAPFLPPPFSTPSQAAMAGWTCSLRRPRMDVTPTSAATSSSSTSTSKSALNQNYQTFLKLLTTQLKNQDPLAPQDSSQFTNQLVLFSQVEQQIDTNSTLNTMLANQQTSLATSAVNYIGKTVAGTGNVFSFDGNHTVPLGYILSAPSASTTVSITNASNQVVYSNNGETGVGDHAFTWNGQDSSGNPVPVGTYTLHTSAFDSNGASVATTTVVPGVVTSVVNTGGTTYLSVGGNQIPLDEVDTVGAGPTS